MTDRIPIITANHKPLRFVLRGESDAWDPTLDQINHRDYDYVKLHRLSTFCNVDIPPFSMGVCYDGTLILPALPLYQEKNQALNKFNEALSELLLGGLYCEAVIPDDIGYGTLTIDGYSKILGGAIGQSGTFHQSARNKSIGILDVIKLIDLETITFTEFNSALLNGREINKRIGGIPINQILYGSTFFVQQQWAEALIHFWTTIERLVEISWNKYVVNSGDIISSRRRAFLDDNRTWTASTKLEMLFQKKLINDQIYKKIDGTRKARNDFIHNGISPDQSTTTKALGVMLEFASLCSSNFQNSKQLNKVNDVILKRCNFDFLPKRKSKKKINVKYWLDLPLPPIPGDENWGDKKYEIIEELCLKPIQENPIK
jgi:hypothetical protein